MSNRSSNLDDLRKKKDTHLNDECLSFLELLTRFELVTSSLPRKCSAY